MPAYAAIQDTSSPRRPSVPPQLERAAQVKNSFVRAWRAYVDTCSTHLEDELRPIAKSCKNWGEANGIGLTLIECLDTLWLMGLKAEFEESVQLLRRLSFDQDAPYSLFETTIRALGGLIAAYELSGNRFLLQLAQDVAVRLYPAFDTSGVPDATVNFHNGQHYRPPFLGDLTSLAEVTTLQRESRRPVSFYTCPRPCVFCPGTVDMLLLSDSCAVLMISPIVVEIDSVFLCVSIGQTLHLRTYDHHIQSSTPADD
eukprot:gene3704-4121_t